MSGVVSTGIPAVPGETTARGDCTEPPPARTPFEAVELDVERFDDAPTVDLDDAELHELCDALAPAFDADCELFAVGSAIEQDALAQAEFETECAEARLECVANAQQRCEIGRAH